MPTPSREPYGSTRGRKPRPLAERFWRKVNQDGPVLRSDLGNCWVWTGSCTTDGYGMILRSADAGSPSKASRISWELAGGGDPGDLHVLHRCDNPPCVRPSHLFLGTRAENMADMAGKHRSHSMQGESNPRARLSAAQVSELRARVAAGERYEQLAEEYGHSYNAVYLAVRGFTWKHLPDPVVITNKEKQESIRKGTADLKAWRERNPDAPKGRPLPPERDEEAEGLL
jgi:hypothetical protein